MSDVTKRQAYVFLQDGDILDGNDEMYADWGEWIEHSFVQVHYAKKIHGLVRRPVATPEQTDKLTVWDEYAKEAMGRMIADPSFEGTAEKIAKLAKNYADAMMKARSEK